MIAKMLPPLQRHKPATTLNQVVPKLEVNPLNMRIEMSFLTCKVTKNILDKKTSNRFSFFKLTFFNLGNTIRSDNT